MAIEGILEAEQLRDYLYSRMRGARGLGDDGTHNEQPVQDEALTLLREIRDLLRKRS
jgi:putative membrane protein